MATVEVEYLSRYKVTPADADHETLRLMIIDLMNEGLQTQTDPFPENDRAFASILDELRPLNKNQLRAKLVISGWLLTPNGEDELRCKECMYYLAINDGVIYPSWICQPNRSGGAACGESDTRQHGHYWLRQYQ